MRLHVNFSVVLPLFGRVVRELQDRYGVTACSSFLYGRDSLPQLRELGIATDYARTLTDFLSTFDERVEPDLDYLRQKEREYGEPHLYQMIAGCRFIGTFEHRRALRLLEAGFRLIEQLFDEFSPDAVVSDGVACTMSFVQYAVAARRGIPFLTVAPARINNRFYVIRNRRDRYERVEALFGQYKRCGLPDPLRREAEDYLDHFRGLKLKPQYFVDFAQPPRVDFLSVRTFSSLIYRRYVLDRRNYLLAPAHQALLGRVTRLIKTYALDPGHFVQPSAGEKFVFFPLHFQPEMTTLVLGPYCVDQIAVIENVAKTLPIDHVLYVKEHKASLGRRPFGYYRRLRRIPNVRLISPYVDSHDLIRASSAVCVISSTVGWEALLYEKPVITLGDVSYNAFDLVRHIRSFDDLPAAFATAIHGFSPDRELLLKFIAANLNGTYEGDAYFTPGAHNPSIRSDNVRQVARVLAEELGLVSGDAFESNLAASNVNS